MLVMSCAAGWRPDELTGLLYRISDVSPYTVEVILHDFDQSQYLRRTFDRRPSAADFIGEAFAVFVNTDSLASLNSTIIGSPDGFRDLGFAVEEV